MNREEFEDKLIIYANLNYDYLKFTGHTSDFAAERMKVIKSRTAEMV